MSGVDDRVVSMKFDNAAFEGKVADTIKSLDNLQKSLDFAGAKRGLDELSTSGRNFDMGNMGSAIEGVSGKFLAMATIGITALSTITAQAIRAGEQLVSSLTIAPISEGFSDYNEKLTSVQTIMNATGADISTVNGYFSQLDTYSDKTIYNLKDMTGAFAKFTNAGLDMSVSVPAIKGIANMVALAGQGADAAAIAMYNLSQSIAGGFLTTMDYKSLNLANVATKEWKDQMIAGAVAAGTLKQAADGTYQTLQDDKVSFEGSYTAASLFTEGLKDQWATTDVLTSVLGAYGDETTDIGKKALAAAQDVKSLPMMLDTLKASVGTGWTSTFEILLGNVEESKQLFTGLTASIQGFLDHFANARNDLLQGWKDLGGRSVLIEGLRTAFGALADIIKPIAKAFRQIFPKETSQGLYDLTVKFTNFMEKIQPSSKTINEIQRAFQGFFSVLNVGWTVLKEIGALFVDLFKAIWPAQTGILEFSASTGDTLTRLSAALVAGGGIHDFFIKIRAAISGAVDFIKNFKDSITGLFDNFQGADVAEQALGRVNSRLDTLKEAAGKVVDVWHNLEDRFSGIADVLDRVWAYIKNWFGELGNKLATAFQPGDFDSAVDVINVGLLGGIILMFKKFLDGGLKIDFGGGLMKKISGAFDQLTGTLKAMQTNLKADALLHIAEAVGILVAAVTVLSMIDSGALTKALSALSVSFAQLIGAMTLLDRIDFDKSAAKLSGLAAGMILLATAAAILTIPIKVLSGLGWTELAKGLIGTAAGLAMLVAAMNLMTTDTGGLIRAGIAMSAISVALILLSTAVRSFATISWGDMVKGMAGIAVGLFLLTSAMDSMPPSSVLSGAGFVEVAVGLNILAGAVKLFSTLGWAEMAKGMVGIGAGLVIIAGAMQLMPISMPITAAGLVLVSGALVVMAGAVKIMGDMDLGELGKGVGALAAMMLILSLAVNAMSGAAGGAVAMIIVAGALTILSKVITDLGKLELHEVIQGLAAVAAVLLVLSAAAILMTPIIPELLLLGVALGVVGAAFALFGAGAFLVAKAFEAMAEAGTAGAQGIVDAISILLSALPDIVTAVVSSIVKMAEELLGAAPLLIRLVTAILSQLLDTVIQLTPKIAQAFGEIISAGIQLISEKYPEFVEAGLKMIEALLEGLREHIGDIITAATELIAVLVQSLLDNMPSLVQSGVDLLTGFINELANHGTELAMAGLNLISQLLIGIAENITMVTDTVVQVIVAILAALAGAALQIVQAGADILISLIAGITGNILRVADAVTQIITTFITTMAGNAVQIAQAGTDALVAFLGGISGNIIEVTNTVGTIVAEFIRSLGANSEKLAGAGIDALVDFITGIGDHVDRAVTAGADVIINFITGLGSNALRIADSAMTTLVNFLDGLALAIRTHSEEIRSAGWDIAMAIIDGLTGGLASKAGDVGNAFIDLGKKGLESLAGPAGFLFGGPSKVMMELGEYVAEGLAIGVGNGSDRVKGELVSMAAMTTSTLQSALSQIPDALGDMDEFNPVITPVLDLTRVLASAKDMDRVMKSVPMTAEMSLSGARVISASVSGAADASDTPTPSGPAEVRFEQNIYSPEALSTSAIYRNTKSQIALAKEELNI